MQAEIPCPEPVRLADNCLVMGFIGRDGWAAPQLREAVPNMSQRARRTAYVSVVLLMRAMYTICRLVHADLSEYNLLYWKRRVFVIDLGQAVEVNHPKAAEFLLRDAEHVTSFFAKKCGLSRLAPPEALVALIAAPSEDGLGADSDFTPEQLKLRTLASNFGPWASPGTAAALADLLTNDFDIEFVRS